MPNQRDIALVLGVNQATVSLALRGDRSVSERMRRRVCETAQRLGYRPNAYVSSLMAHIRSGRRPSAEGVLAVLVKAHSEEEWFRMESYRIYYDGMKRRAAELGFRIECFFLEERGMSAQIVDRILEARGIQGVILAPPYPGNRSLRMRWERYACVGMGHGWEPQQLDRVANDHAQNVLTAFAELDRLGYSRVGFLLGGLAATGGKGLRWLPGFLEAQSRLPAGRRVPLYTGKLEKKDGVKFEAWVRTHHPDALLVITGEAQVWLESLGYAIPGDFALACLVRSRDGNFAGVDEKNDVLGEAAVELVASRIARNEFGLPKHPRLTVIDGRWIDGPTAGAKANTHRDEQSGHCPAAMAQAR
jgi:LacI family transcriptional regulator